MSRRSTHRRSNHAPVVIKWHGDRHAILGFADALVVQLRRLFGYDPVAIIARLEVTAGQRELLLDTYPGKGSE